MAHFLPTFVAFLFKLVLNSSVFFNDEAYNGVPAPLLSSILFILAVNILILDTKLYPRNIRRLHWMAMFLYQFIATIFITECTLCHFFYPLEARIIKLLPWIGEKIVVFGQSTESEIVLFGTKILSQFVQSTCGMFLSSYILSMSYLLGVLHATRLADMGLLFRLHFIAFFSDLLRNIRIIQSHMASKMDNPAAKGNEPHKVNFRGRFRAGSDSVTPPAAIINQCRSYKTSVDTFLRVISFHKEEANTT